MRLTGKQRSLLSHRRWPRCLDLSETRTSTSTKTSTSFMDVPIPEDHGKDSKPSPSEPKPSEPSKSTPWPFLKIVALSLMLLGATAAFFWYRRQQGTQAATLQTQEVEIQEIRRAGAAAWNRCIFIYDIL